MVDRQEPPTPLQLDLTALLGLAVAAVTSAGLAAQFASYEAASEYFLEYGITLELTGITPLNAAWRMRETFAQVVYSSWPWLFLFALLFAAPMIGRATYLAIQSYPTLKANNKKHVTDEQVSPKVSRVVQSLSRMLDFYIRILRRRWSILAVLILALPLLIGEALTRYADISHVAREAAREDIIEAIDTAGSFQDRGSWSSGRPWVGSGAGMIHSVR